MSKKDYFDEPLSHADGQAFKALIKNTNSAIDADMPLLSPAVSKLQQALTDSLEDTRVQYLIKYDAFAALTVIILARLGGVTRATDIADFWLDNKEKLQRCVKNLGDDVPSHDTIARLIALFDPGDLQKIIFKGNDQQLKLAEERIAKAWEEIFAEDENDFLSHLNVLCADGQLMRSTAMADAEIGKRYGSGLNVVTIFDASLYVVLEQKITTEKNQEAKVILGWIKGQRSTIGKLLSFDAINTHPEILSEMTDRGGHILASIKANNKNTYEEIKDAFDSLFDGTADPHWAGHKHVIKAKGSGQTGDIYWNKELYALPIEDTLTPEIAKLWPGVKSIICVRNSRTFLSHDDESSSDAYFLCSIPCTFERTPKDKIEEAKAYRADFLLQAVISRWGLENLHQHVDRVNTFNQDRHRILNTRFANNNCAITKGVIAIVKTVQSVSVTVHSRGFRDDPLPISRLVTRARNLDIAISYLDYFFYGRTKGLIDAKIMWGGDENYGFHNPLDGCCHQLALAELLAKKGRRRSSRTKKS